MPGRCLMITEYSEERQKSLISGVMRGSACCAAPRPSAPRFLSSISTAGSAISGPWARSAPGRR